jgi:hypothetical protein
VPQTINDVIDPPTYETLEVMITRLEAMYAGTASPLPSTETLPTAPTGTVAAPADSLRPSP